MPNCQSCVEGMNAILAAMQERVNCALESAESPATDRQHTEPATCPCFVDGAKCFNENTLLKCFEKPCVLVRGKQQAGRW